MKKLYAILAFLFIVISTSAQGNLTVSGTIYDEFGETLVGAVVFHKKDKARGVTSDVDGKFTLNASKGDILVFTYLGYESIEYTVKQSETDLKIKFETSNNTLEEVVVTGLGSQRKISVVGSISTIDTEQLQVPATSMANILGGRMPGVITTLGSGEPGKNISEFWIRGIGTFGANSAALVLIDGLEGDLNSIDPADVESFSILKDASATAVYGVRGANGVVLVTTKRGGKGKLKVKARANFTVSELRRMPKYLGAYEYAKLANEARGVRDGEPIYGVNEMAMIQHGLDLDLYPNVDWQKEIIDPVGLQQTYYVSAAGGGDIATYFISGGLSKEDAAYKMDKNSPYKASTGYNTYNYRSNLGFKLTNTTTVNLNIDGYFTQKKEPGLANTDILWAAQSQLTPLTIPTRYSTGELPAWGSETNFSPYVMLNHSGKRSQETYESKVALNLEQDLNFITDGLKIKLLGAYTNKNYFDESRLTLPEMHYASSRDVNGQLQLAKKLDKVDATYNYGQRQYRKYNLDFTAFYDKQIADAHRISALAYYSMEDSKDTYDIDNPGSVPKSMAAIPKRYQAFSSRLSYSYADTYFIDGNFGYTGSENFKKGDRFGFFPSVAIGWAPTTYEWVKENLSWLNFLKIRGSYGTVGNEKISDTRFPYLTLINDKAPSAWNGGYVGIAETTIGADNLKWEKATKANLGLDAFLFDNAVNITVDVFKDNRDGIFQRRTQIPELAGLTQMPFGNVGKMKSYGSDGNISYIHKVNPDMSFTIRGNYTYARNEVKNWEQASPKYPYQSYSGLPYNAMRGYMSLGLFKDEQDVKSSPVQSFGGIVRPGDIKYKDVNGDGKIDTDDQIVLNYPSFPRLMYGFGGEFQYKDLIVGFLFKGTGNKDYFHVGQNVNNAANGMGYVPFHGGELGNVLTIVADQSNRWTPESYSGDKSTENPNARFPRLDYGYNANNSQMSTFWKGNARYLRLQEVSLKYKLRHKSMGIVGLESIDLEFVGSNLIVWDTVKLWDPEQAANNGRAYPIPARYTFQLYLNF